MDGKDGAPVGYLIELKCNITEAKEEKTKEFQKKRKIHIKYIWDIGFPNM